MTTEKFKILSEYVKDMSSETPNVQTYLYVKDNISKYHLNIEITSKALRDKVIEVNTSLTFLDKDGSERKANFEIVYSSVVKIENEIKDENILQKILLCDVQNKIYPKLENAFLNMLTNSGYPNIQFTKKVDFEKLYKEKFN